MGSIKDNITLISSKIENLRKIAGRQNKVTLMAVTKFHSVEEITEALESGISVIGENRVQELNEKYPQLNGKCEIHMIGNLQKNKIKYLVGKVDYIDSVGSLELAKDINKLSSKMNTVTKILLEINIGNDPAKSGFEKELIPDVLKEISNLHFINVCGFMCILPIEASNSSQQDELFEEMWRIFIDNKMKKYDNVDINILSMGMSTDYESAVLHGSNMVRIGTSIFGPRNYL